MNRSWSLAEAVALAVASAFGAAFADDWIGGAAVATLWIVWKYMRDAEGLPVLAMALTFQWMQVTIGIWYFGLTGRHLDAMDLSNYRPMVLIGLGCVLALTVGLSGGLKLARHWHRGDRVRESIELGVKWPVLLALYAVSLLAQGLLQDLAFEYPTLTQAILSFRFAHLALLFIVLRRLTRPTVRLPLIASVIALEIALGLTQYFAGFRDPIIMAVIATFEVFNPRRFQHWIVVATAAVLLAIISVMWIGVRGAYRADLDAEVFEQVGRSKFDTITALSQGWLKEGKEDMLADLEVLLNRMWVIYYPALTVARVPSVLPYTHGSLLLATVEHVASPRVFFPTKAELQSDSDLVRKYTGLFVAGTEQNTSIAFGYAAEMYIDFGVPVMFLPIAVFGLLMGVAYEELRIRIHHDELRRGLLAVIFWLTFYLFERSLAKTMGLAGTLLIYLAAPALMLDYYLSRNEVAPAAIEPDFEEEDERAKQIRAWHLR